MKRRAEPDDNLTKRLILGVEHLSLNPTKQIDSFLSLEGVQLVNDSDESSMESETSNISDQESEEGETRARSKSEPKASLGEFTNKLERSWSLNNFHPTKFVERKPILIRVKRITPRKWKNEVSGHDGSSMEIIEPPARRKGNKNTGYSAGCECDSDVEEISKCTNCRRQRG